MATIWDLAVLYRLPDVSSWDYGVQVFDVPGGKAGPSFSAFATLEQGAADLMEQGFEPFGASRTINPLYDNIWFRCEVKTIQIRIKPGVLRKIRRR